ncbi:MAG: alpha/beta hydrolase [Flavobacteriales bacterium]|nr:alpha/beta hydrolase [Flavobacteriales bacterium]
MVQEKQIQIRDGKVTLNYLTAGAQDTSIVFLHGWCINASYWEAQLNYFKDKYSVYAIDLAGFGQSTASRDHWTIEEYARDVIAFINELQLKNVILVGHSMSGAVMMETAIKFPEPIIGLVGVDNFKFIDLILPPEQAKMMQSLFKAMEEDFATNAPLFAENLLFHPSTPEDIKERVKSDFSTADSVIGFNSFQHLIQYTQIEARRLENLPLKLHLINSDVPPTNIAGLENHCTKGFEIHSIGTTGHYPMLESVELFNKQLERVITSCLVN